MLYIFYGKDTFSIRQALNELKASLDPDGLESSTVIFDGRQVTPEELMAACDTVPFLSSHRLVIVEGLLQRLQGDGHRSRRARTGKAAEPSRPGGRPSGRWDALGEYVGRMPPSTALVLVDEGVLPTNPLLATLRPKAQVREFRPIDQKAVPAWVRTRAAEMGLSLSREAIQLLADLVGSNLWTLAGELDKLAAYSDGRPVTEEDVRSLVAAAKEANIFAMVDAIVERRPASAVRLLRQLAAQGVTSAHVFGMIVRQYRLLLLAREMLDARAPSGRIAEALDIRSAFALDRLLDRAERYTIPRLKGAYRRLLEADASIKRGIHSEELALDLLIHDLAAA